MWKKKSIEIISVPSESTIQGVKKNNQKKILLCLGIFFIILNLGLILAAIVNTVSDRRNDNGNVQENKLSQTKVQKLSLSKDDNLKKTEKEQKKTEHSKKLHNLQKVHKSQHQNYQQLNQTLILSQDEEQLKEIELMNKNLKYSQKLRWLQRAIILSYNNLRSNNVMKTIEIPIKP